jgi:hypothetical protein
MSAVEPNFIAYGFDKLRPNGRKIVHGDAEPIEASNHELAVMKPVLDEHHRMGLNPFSCL